MAIAARSTVAIESSQVAIKEGEKTPDDGIARLGPTAALGVLKASYMILSEGTL